MPTVHVQGISVMPYRPARHVTKAASVKSMKELPDNMEAEHAQRLASRIDAWWHDRGFPGVKHWIEKAYPRNEKSTVYVVRGNLVNGLPPKEAV